MKAKNKIVAYFIKHKLFFCLLICLPLYHFLIVNGAKPFSVTDFTYPYFAVDFSMGFCDKFFIGELFHLLVGKYTFEAATAFVSVFYALFILLISFLLDSFFLAFEQNKKACLVIICFALIGPFSFNIFIKQFGMLDFFWAFFFFAAILCLNNKYLKYFVPVLALLMILVHYGALICYVAALLLIIFFYILKAGTKSERISYIVILSVTAILCVGFALYFVKNNSDNLVYPLEEFRHIVQDKRGASSSYYDTAFYKELPLEAKTSELYQKAYDIGVVGNGVMYVNNVFELLKIQVVTTIHAVSTRQIIFCFAAALVPWTFFIYVIKCYFKHKATVIMKILTVLLMIMCLIVQLIGCFLSTDSPRWFADSFIILFTFISLVLYFEYNEGMMRINLLFSKMGYHFVYVLIFFSSNIILPPYTFSFF